MTKYEILKWNTNPELFHFTCPHDCGCKGDDNNIGSAIPGSYKLVLPLGNGIPLSDVNITNVSSVCPAAFNSSSISPIPTVHKKLGSN